MVAKSTTRVPAVLIQTYEPVTEHSDDRSAMAKAIARSSEAISIALEMVLPALLGLWIDRQLGTVMVFLLLGAALGMTLGLLHLVRLAKSLGGQPTRHRSPRDESADQSPKENAGR